MKRVCTRLKTHFHRVWTRFITTIAFGRVYFAFGVYMGTAYGQDCVSYPTVALWIRRFSNERESLEDDPRSGRPITAITQKNIDAIKDLVDEDPHISIDYMAAILDISHGSVDTILKQHLGLRKISSRWVPHSLTQEQRQRRVDILYRKVYNTSNIFS